MNVALTDTETCPLYPAHYIHQTTRLVAHESVRFVSVLIPHGVDESPHAIASSLRATYEPRGDGGYAVIVSLHYSGVDLTASVDGVSETDRATATEWTVKRTPG
eukprot:SAG31_NODE_5988_length_2224_cov_1.683765_2_plen_104_part_00